MDSQVNYIRQRLSLRKPLAKALELTARITDKLSLNKPPTDPDMLEMFITAELAKVKSIVPTVKGFDRDFPSLAFSIATGIGKTRLMGAIIAYLYLKKGIKHFFVLAPNRIYHGAYKGKVLPTIKTQINVILELHRQVFLVSLAVWQVQEVRDRA